MAFRNLEKRRYVDLKPKLFSTLAQPDGGYAGKPRPFCVADGRSSENLHESIRDESIRYFRERGIPWHDGSDDESEPDAARAMPSNHLCCSQCACVNALAPMMRDGDLLTKTFRPFLPDLAEPLPMDADNPLPDGSKPYMSFEWIGMTNYLGEVGGRMRGANATSADFAFRFRRYDGRIQLILGEWKYTEFYNKALPEPEAVNKTQLRVYRQAFDRWRERQPDLPPYEKFFVDPFYQLMRLTLLAQETEQARLNGEGEMHSDIVSVVHVSPNANRDFAEGFTSPSFSNYGRTVTAAWSNIAPKDRFTGIASESLLTAIEQAAPDAMSGWRDWLLARYGWWR